MHLNDRVRRCCRGTLLLQCRVCCFQAVLVLFCWLAAANGEEQKAVNSSVVSDNVSAESAPRLYSDGFKVYASGAPYTLTFRAQDLAKAASQVIPVKEENVFIQNQHGFLKDSYGNQYKVGSPQAVAYKTSFPQQYVRLQDLPVHLSQPLIPGFNYNGKGPQFSYTAPTFRFSTLTVTPTPIVKSQFPSHGYASNIRSLSPVHGRYTIPPGSPLQQPSNSAAVYASQHYSGQHRPQQGPKFQRLEEHTPHGFKITQGSGNLNNKNVIHSTKENLQNALQGGIQGAPVKQVTVITYNNGQKTAVSLETQPPLPLLDLNLLQPLHFDNPIVPQVQHFLPKINYPIPQVPPVEQKNHHNEFVVKKTKSYDTGYVPQQSNADDEEEEEEEEEAPPPQIHHKKPTHTHKQVPHNEQPLPKTYEINSPNYKETYNEQVVKYDKKTDSEPVTYTYNMQTEKKPVSYSYTKSSKAPIIDKHLSYEVHGTGPKQQIIIHSAPESKYQHHEEEHHHVEHHPHSHQGQHHHSQGDHQGGHHHHSPANQGDHHHQSQGHHRGEHHPQSHHQEERHYHHPQSDHYHHEERHHSPQTHHQSNHHYHPHTHHQGEHHHHHSSRQEALPTKRPESESQQESDDSRESEESNEQRPRDYSGEEQDDDEIPSHQLKAEHREVHDHNPHKVPQQIISNVQNQYGHLHSSPPPQFQSITLPVTTIQSITPHDYEENIRIQPTGHPNGEIKQDHRHHQQNVPVHYNEHNQQHQNNPGVVYHGGFNAQIQVHPQIIKSSPAPQIQYTTHQVPAQHVSSPQPQRQQQPTRPPQQHHHQSPSPSPQSYYGANPQVIEKSRKIIIQEETPDEMHSHREQMIAEMINQDEDNEEDFEKAYKEAAFGFPAYEYNSEQIEKNVYNPASYGSPRYKDDEDDFEHSPLQQYHEEGDEFPKSARLTYKDDKENLKEDYFLDYSVHKPEIELDRHKNKVGYYKMFKKQRPKYFYGDAPEKKQKKSEKLTADLFGYNSYHQPKQVNYFAHLKQAPKFEYSYAKEAPRDSFAYASSGPRKTKTLFVEPQFQYGFEPISLPSILGELSAMATNIRPESEKPGTRKKIYKETFHIKKTSTGSEPNS